MTGVVLGDQTDNQSTDGSHGDAHSRHPGSEFELTRPHGLDNLERLWQEEDTGVVDGGNHQDGRGDELDLQSLFDLVLGLDGLDVCGNEGADQANKDTNRGNAHGEDHGVPSTRNTDAAADDESSAGTFRKGSKQVTAHTGDVSHVVTDVIGNGGRVARIVLWDAVHDLSNEIGTHIGGLGVDSSTDATKHGNHGTSQTVSRDGLGQVDPLVGARVVQSEDQQGDVEHQQTHGAEGESHDGTRAKGRVEAGRPAGLLRRDGGAYVAVDGHFHAQVATRHGSKGSEQEGDGRKGTSCHVPAGSPRNENQNDDTKDHDKPETDGVLGTQEGLGTLVDGFVDLLETHRLLGIVAVAR